MGAEKHAGGRPTDFKEEYIGQAYKLCLLGFTDVDMADFFGVCKATINNWKKAVPEFLDSITQGKTLADANVAESMYKRAIGYEHEEEKVFCNMGQVTTHSTIKHYAPDSQAASLWLRNRQPSKWRDKTEIDHITSDGSMSPTVEARNKARAEIESEFDD